MITIMVCFHSGSFRNFKHYYLFFICDYMKSYFPNALSYNRFVELQPCLIVPFLLFLKPGGFVECTGITYIDSTPIKVCHNKRIKRNKVFKDFAQIGKSTMAGFSVLSSILYATRKANCLIFPSPKPMSMIETLNDELKNICRIEHSGHRSTHNFIMNIIAVLTAYCFFPKKLSIQFNIEKSSQLIIWG